MMTKNFNLTMLQYAKHIMEKKEEQRSTVRKRNLLVLIHSFFLQNGYSHSAETLKHESSTNFDTFAVCDNVDLEIILQEYETFQYVKFRHYPHLVKKLPLDTSINQTTSNKRPVSRVRPVSKTLAGHLSVGNPVEAHRESRSGRKESLPSESVVLAAEKRTPSRSPPKSSDSQLSVEGTKFVQPVITNIVDKGSPSPSRCMEGTKMLPSLRNLPDYTAEWQHLIQVISKDIYSGNPNVGWNDIVGLDTAKRLVKEAVVFPIKYPEIFSGILTPWKGLLLFGPPGNGKTLLAKAVATECRTTFFNISATTIVSKWRGDSEKLVRVLFELARLNAPSTIFVDEMDALMCRRETQGNSEHEASRRMKTELLVQMDGLANSNDLVFLLAATNVPWDLDHAVLRRLEKRVLVPLPNREARKMMFQKFLPVDPKAAVLPVGDLDYERLSVETEGYSAADVRLVCKESAMQAVRRVLLDQDGNEQGEVQIMEKIQPVETSNVLSAITCTKPSAKDLASKYHAWNSEYGST